MRTRLFAVIVGCLCAACSKGAASVSAAQAGAPAAVEEAKAYDVALKASGPASAEISIAARDGFHVNPDYPLKFTPSKESTVTFAGPSVALLEVLQKTPCEAHPEDTCRATAPIAFTSGVGPALVAGTLAFSVCNADQCLIEKVALRCNL